MLTLTMPYALYEAVRLLAEAHGATIEEQHFAADVTLKVGVDADRAAALSRR